MIVEVDEKDVKKANGKQLNMNINDEEILIYANGKKDNKNIDDEEDQEKGDDEEDIENPYVEKGKERTMKIRKRLLMMKKRMLVTKDRKNADDVGDKEDVDNENKQKTDSEEEKKNLDEEKDKKMAYGGKDVKIVDGVEKNNIDIDNTNTTEDEEKERQKLRGFKSDEKTKSKSKFDGILSGEDIVQDDFKEKKSQKTNEDKKHLISRDYSKEDLGISELKDNTNPISDEISFRKDNEKTSSSNDEINAKIKPEHPNSEGTYARMRTLSPVGENMNEKSADGDVVDHGSRKELSKQKEGIVDETQRQINDDAKDLIDDVKIIFQM
ncbi:uncharacterized protein DDB_G0283697-like [Xenia sp. Carnegie-2017]|uniref:uncharacterized protein DDB_G0283697-like n=1 Tax=Xenia sp. Carnegie-2017 TaxID=2897299 RepID=UPI001F03FBF6|nr:uncharacterized protein DDB_G0283697-like [Xenia sp. Carnegie-2017]